MSSVPLAPVRRALGRSTAASISRGRGAGELLLWCWGAATALARRVAAYFVFFLARRMPALGVSVAAFIVFWANTACLCKLANVPDVLKIGKTAPAARTRKTSGQ